MQVRREAIERPMVSSASNLYSRTLMSNLGLLAYLNIFITIISVLNFNPTQAEQSQDLQENIKQQELRCLACIRQASSTGIQGDLTKQKCDGYFCGPFQINYQYWAEAGKPRANSTSGGVASRDFEKCAKDKQCAEETVRAHFNRFKRDCNNDGRIDCLDMAALHKAGPSSCASDWFYKSRYWQAFNRSSCANSEQNYELAELPGKRNVLETNLDDASRVVMKNQTLTSECLDCICEALTGCGSSRPHNCGSGSVCGPFSISQEYWKEGRRPGASWTACTRTRECSVVAIKNYMDKNKRDCNSDGYITCEDYAAIHRRGPRGCTNRDLFREPYWHRFLACQANQKPAHDTNTVKVDADLASRGEQIRPEQSGLVSTSASNGPTIGNNEQLSTAITTMRRTISSNAPTTTAYFSPARTFEATSAKHKPSETSLSGSLDDRDSTLTATTIYSHHQSQATTRSRVKTTNAPRTSLDASMNTQAVVEQSSSGPDQRLQPQRPIIDYNNLPTIIVSKPIGAASSQRYVPAPNFQPTIKIEQTATFTTTTSTTTTEKPSSSPVEAQTLHSTNRYESILTTVPLIADATLGSISSVSSKSGSDSIIDYSIPEPFPFASASGGPASEEIVHDAVDRTSFDRVINGIVANPDFSKSYPPTYGSPESALGSRRRTSPQPGESIVNEQRLSQKSRVTPIQPQDHGIRTEHGGSANRKESSIASRAASSSTTPAFLLTDSSNPSEATVRTEQSPAQASASDALSSISHLFELSQNETGHIASECLNCICDASSNCDATVQCISKQREKNRCGLYMISWNQYKESDISLAALLGSPATGPHSNSSSDDYDEKLYYECSTDKSCAERLINLYVEKHQKDCNEDGKIDCFDIAAIHRVGPDLCNSSKFLGSQYWKDFNICYATERLTTTTTTTTMTSATVLQTSSTHTPDQAITTTRRHQQPSTRLSRLAI